MPGESSLTKSDSCKRIRIWSSTFDEVCDGLGRVLISSGVEKASAKVLLEIVVEIGLLNGSLGPNNPNEC